METSPPSTPMSVRMCPLCTSRESNCIGLLPVSFLVDFYQRGAGIDVAKYFQDVHEFELNRCHNCDLRFYWPLRPGDDRFYEKLQELPWYYQDDKPEYHYVQQYIDRGCKVLEVGCGKGAFSTWIPESVSYTGLEFNDAAVTKGRGLGIEIIRQTIADHIKQTGREYDVVCNFQVLEHVPQPRTFLEDCIRALRPGGKLIIAVPAEDSFLQVAQNEYLNMPPHHLLRWTDDALRSITTEFGLKLEAIWHEPVASFHEAWHQLVLGRFYFSRHRAISNNLIERSIFNRIVGRLLRVGILRKYCANKVRRSNSKYEHGHTVVLVASKPDISNV